MHNPVIATVRMLSLFGVLTSLYVASNLASAAHAKPEVPVKVMASIRPLALIAKDIGGEAVQVEVLLDRNASAHDFSLTIGQAMTLSTADLLLSVGPDFEHFLTGKLLPKHLTVDSSTSSHHHDQGEDPHLWLKHESLYPFIDSLAALLSDLRPTDQKQFMDAATSLRSRLRDQQKRLRMQFSTQRKARAISHHQSLTHLTDALALSRPLPLTQVPHQRVGVKQLRSISTSAKGAKCMLGERVESREARRYAALLDLPFVEIDLMAGEDGIASYPEYIEGLAKALTSCFSIEK